jgi:hypothetical protein
VWEKGKSNANKYKGVYCELKNEYTPEVHKLLGIPTFTVAGFVLPYAIKYGNYALKQATQRKEEKYKAEFSSLNWVNLDLQGSNPDEPDFSVNIYYFPKGNTSTKDTTKYSFKTIRNNSEVLFRLVPESSTDHLIPVKTKNNYDFVIVTFEFSIHAIAIININSTKIKKRIDLGIDKQFHIYPNYRSNSIEHLEFNQGNIIIPEVTDNGDKIQISEILVCCTVQFLNPYGLTHSVLNSFLEDTSDTNEELLNNILIKSEE